MFHRSCALVLALPSLALVGCGDGAKDPTQGSATETSSASASSSDGDTDGAGSTTSAAMPVTWYQDIQPIVAGHCWGCHNAEGGLSFSFQDYALAAPWAPLMLTKIVGDSAPPFFMPPWSARESDTCAPPLPWKDDSRLSADEIALIEAWIADGTPEGDPASAAPLPPWKPEELTGDQVATLPSAGYTLAAGAKVDEYRCFSLDPGITGDRWITGLQVEPGNDKIVHHVVLFGDPEGESAALADADGSYPCFGGSNIANSQPLYAWAPGGNPLELPESVGIPVPAGARLVMQVHYHPTGQEESDATALRLRWTDQKPAHEALMAIIGGVLPSQTFSSNWDDPPFQVPAGAKDHVEVWRETIDLPLGLDLRIWSIFPHMHLVGVRMDVRIERAGESICLGELPHWDFDWQRTYAFDAPYSALPRVQDGDQVVVRCVYDNTMANTSLAKALTEEGIPAPMDTGVGEATFDEMCVAIIGVSY